MSIRINVGATFDARDLKRAQGELDALKRQADTLSNRMSNLGARFEKVGAKVAGVGKTFTRSLTLPILGAGIAGIKTAADFETSMSKITGLVGIAAGEVKSMESAVLKLAGETAKSPKELADALFVLTSAGLRGKDALDALESSAKAGAAGLGETNDIARAVAGSINAYGSGVLSAAKATDVIVATARAGNFETSQFAGALGRVLPFAKQAGASIEDLGGAVALLTRTNGDAAQSVTQVQALFRAFVVPTQEAIKALDGVGLSAQNMRDAIAKDGLPAALDMLDRKLGGNREQLGRLLGSSEAAAAAFQILDADAESLAGTFGVVNDSVNITGDAFNTVAQTSAFRFSQAMANLQASLVDVGNIVLPFVTRFVEGFGRIVTSFKNLDTEQQKTIVKFALVVAAIGPVIFIIGKLIAVFGALFVALSFLIAHPVVFAVVGLAALFIGLAAAVFHFREAIVRAAGAALDRFHRKYVKALNDIIHVFNLSLGPLADFGVQVKKLPTELPIIEAFDEMADKVAEFSIGGVVARALGDLSFFTQKLTGDGLDYQLAWRGATETQMDFNEVATGASSGSGSSGTVGAVVTLSKAMRESLKFINSVTSDTRRMGAAVRFGGDLIGQFARNMLSAKEITADTGGELNQLATTIRQRLNSALEEGNRRLDDAKQKFNSFADSIAGGIKSGNLLKDSARLQEDALKSAASAQEEYNEALDSGDEDRIAVAAAALEDAKKQQGSFLDFLRFGATTAEEFAKQIDQLRLAGASMELLQEIAQMGVETGSRIAAELLAGGADAIAETNRLLQAVNAAAEAAGKAAAQQFHSAGIAAAEAFIQGIESLVPELQFFLDRISLMFEKLFPDAKKPDVTIVPEGQFVMRPGRGSVDEQIVASQDFEAVSNRVAQVFINRGVTIGTGGETEQERIVRITSEIASGQRTFDDLRRSVDFIARQPRDQLSSSVSSSATNINVNVTGAIDPEATARVIIKTLDDAQRRTGVRIGV